MNPIYLSIFVVEICSMELDLHSLVRNIIEQDLVKRLPS